MVKNGSIDEWIEERWKLIDGSINVFIGGQKSEFKIPKLSINMPKNPKILTNFKPVFGNPLCAVSEAGAHEVSFLVLYLYKRPKIDIQAFKVSPT